MDKDITESVLTHSKRLKILSEGKMQEALRAPMVTLMELAIALKLHGEAEKAEEISRQADCIKYFLEELADAVSVVGQDLEDVCKDHINSLKELEDQLNKLTKQE